MLAGWEPRILSVLRIVSGLLFLLHGTQKLIGIPTPTRGMPEMYTLMWSAGVLEVVGGALLIIGLFTRPVAFVLSGMMAVAYFMAHAPQDLFPTLNGGDAAILFSFIFLYLFVAGGGSWSVDRMMSRD